jgi:hypothetical protein
MFLLDDILLAPVKGLASVCQKLYEAAQNDLDGQEKEIVATLSDLYQQLESHQIGDEQFNAREGDLLDRLEEVRRLSKPENEGE